MKSAKEIILDKYRELIHRLRERDQFTHVERVMFLVVDVRTTCYADAFSDLYVDVLTRSDFVEVIGYIHELGLTETANAFEEVMSLLDSNKYFASDGWADKSPDELPQGVQDQLKALGDYITQGLLSPTVDERLLEMLNREAKP